MYSITKRQKVLLTFPNELLWIPFGVFLLGSEEALIFCRRVSFKALSLSGTEKCSRLEDIMNVSAPNTSAGLLFLV
jgi:hypothetical protein